MTDQSQKATDNAFAIQSKGDVTINQGMSAEDMARILSVTAESIKIFEQKALDVAEKRIADFQKEVLKRFSDNTEAKREAFADPDFQYVLHKAQQVQARIDDPKISDTLVDLIVERSKQEKRSRLALSINDAIEKVSVLTANEFAALSLVFLLRYTRNHSLIHISFFEKYLVGSVFPFLPDISRDEGSYRYLQSHGCASISMGSIELQKIFTAMYGTVFSAGIVSEKVFNLVSKEDQIKLIQSTLIGPPQVFDGKRITINADDRNDVAKKLTAVGLSPSIADEIWSLRTQSLWPEAEVVDKLVSALPGHAKDIRLLFELWSTTLMKHLDLTTTGFAIAHANLRRVTKFAAGLEIWIK